MQGHGTSMPALRFHSTCRLSGVHACDACSMPSKEYLKVRMNACHAVQAMVDNLQLEQPSKGDDAVVAAFQRLVDRTARPGVKDVLMLNQAKLVKEEVTSEEAL